jgi:hypothetical protein
MHIGYSGWVIQGPHSLNGVGKEKKFHAKKWYKKELV